jgi:hypothetical protein
VGLLKILLNRRSHPPSIPEEEGEGDRDTPDPAALNDGSCRLTPDVALPIEERVGIGATFRKGRNGVFEVFSIAQNTIFGTRNIQP